MGDKMTPTERMREWRAKQPKRKCECGRDLDKRCTHCSECAQVRRDIKLEIYRYNYKKNNHDKILEYEKQRQKERVENGYYKRYKIERNIITDIELVEC
jgi:hypothetical protein